MARQLRIEYAGAYYHVMARGDRRENIFFDKEDYELFMVTLSGAARRCGWRLHAWALMSNHYHLLLETPEPNLVAGMTWLQNTYTRRFNLRHKLWGHLFGGRYKASPVEQPGGEGSEKYFALLLDYIHLNPARAKMMAAGDGILSYPWCSLAQAYAVEQHERLPWMAVGAGLAVHQCKDDAEGRRRFVGRLEKIWEGEVRSGKVGQRGGVSRHFSTADSRKMTTDPTFFGSEAFKKKMLALLKEQDTPKSADYRYGAEAVEHGQRRAEEIVTAGLAHFKLRREELKELAGNDARKAEIAYAVFNQTNVSNAWIAKALEMSSGAYVSHILGKGGWGQSSFFDCPQLKNDG